MDFSKAYKVEGYGGVAWRADKYEVVYESEDIFDVDDEYIETTVEEYDNLERVVCHMIGDDTPFTFEVDELTAINDEDYCSGCGQIGCGWC